MGFIVNGQIVQILPAQQGVSQRGNQWMRQSYILEHESGQYPKRMVFDVRDAKIQELNLQQGEWVTLHFNCDCREYPQGSGKYFNSIEAWKVVRAGQPQYQQSQYQQHVQQQFPPQVNAQGQPVQQPMTGAAPFPPQQPGQQQPVASPFPPQPAGVNQPVQGQQLPFPPAQ